jgi:hypothetical protein
VGYALGKAFGWKGIIVSIIITLCLCAIEEEVNVVLREKFLRVINL